DPIHLISRDLGEVFENHHRCLIRVGVLHWCTNRVPSACPQNKLVCILSKTRLGGCSKFETAQHGNGESVPAAMVWLRSQYEMGCYSGEAGGGSPRHHRSIREAG